MSIAAMQRVGRKVRDSLVLHTFDADEPSMPPAERAHFGRRVEAAGIYLEYGAGGSTVAAARLGVRVIHSVESDRKFLGAVQRRLQHAAGKMTWHPWFGDIGRTKAWGWPADNAGRARWPKYAFAPWPALMANGERPDVVLIDGRFRVACFLVSLAFAKPGTLVLFDDYYDRPHYHVVETLLEPAARIGRMAEFGVPEGIDARRALEAAAPYLMDPA